MNFYYTIYSATFSNIASHEHNIIGLLFHNPQHQSKSDQQHVFSSFTQGQPKNQIDACTCSYSKAICTHIRHHVSLSFDRWFVIDKQQPEAFKVVCTLCAYILKCILLINTSKTTPKISKLSVAMASRYNPWASLKNVEHLHNQLYTFITSQCNADEYPSAIGNLPSVPGPGLTWPRALLASQLAIACGH